MVALKNANEENKATKSELEGVTNDLKLAVKEVVSLKAQLEDSQIKLEEERNQATAITMQMFEMEQKLNVEKICVGMQTDVVVAPVVVEQSAPPLDPVLSRPSSISLTPQTTQNNHTSSNRSDLMVFQKRLKSRMHCQQRR
uniref:Uncharacterized protein n=1 Tax=Ditylenchus dipsaci TaxID=166011 RepID=A0A915EH26_9BILA